MTAVLGWVEEKLVPLLSARGAEVSASSTGDLGQVEKTDLAKACAMVRKKKNYDCIACFFVG